MKTKLFSIAIALMLCVTMFGQPGQVANKDREVKKIDKEQGMDKDHGANFTEEQKAKMKEIRIASYKEIKPLKNQLGELEAKQQTLVTADKPDINAINANIDEITKIQNKIMKIKALHHQQVRALLTDEQKIWFDSHKMSKGERMDGERIGFDKKDGFRENMEKGPRPDGENKCSGAHNTEEKI